MFTGLFILFIEATSTISPLVTLLPLLHTLPSTTGSMPGIARSFTHRSELYASLYASQLYYFTTRYFTHDQCREWKYSDFRGEISYFTHELYAQNCIKIFALPRHRKFSNWLTENVASICSQRARLMKSSISLFENIITDAPPRLTNPLYEYIFVAGALPQVQGRFSV